MFIFEVMECMKKKIVSWLMAGLVGVSGVAGAFSALPTEMVSAAGSCQVEYLDRGISAINTGAGMLVSWRFLPMMQTMQSFSCIGTIL